MKYAMLQAVHVQSSMKFCVSVIVVTTTAVLNFNMSLLVMIMNCETQSIRYMYILLPGSLELW